MSLVATLLPGTSPQLGRVLRVVPALVGLGRMYVGAHLPLDVAGGAAFGRAVSGSVDYVSWILFGTAQPAQGRVDRDR